MPLFFNVVVILSSSSMVVKGSVVEWPLIGGTFDGQAAGLAVTDIDGDGQFECLVAMYVHTACVSTPCCLCVFLSLSSLQHYAMTVTRARFAIYFFRKLVQC